MVAWIGVSIHFHIALDGTVFNRIGVLLFVPGPVAILLSGLTGRLLADLALYTGRSMIYPKEG